jgi:hypothetical protein
MSGIAVIRAEEMAREASRLRVVVVAGVRQT